MVPEILAAAVLAAASGAAWILAPYGWRRLQERALDARCRSQRAIVLSYDDGPGTTLTPALIELFRAESVRANFFLLGSSVERAPDIARRLVIEGHEVGSHTEAHSNAWKTLPRRVARDVAAGRRAVDGIGGDGRLFRPPFGKITLAGLVLGLGQGLRFGWWTIDSGDSWRRRPIAEVLGEISAKGGGVVLMHDGDGYARVADEPVGHVEHVLELTRGILALARAEGYRVTTLGALDRTPS